MVRVGDVASVVNYSPDAPTIAGVMMGGQVNPRNESDTILGEAPTMGSGEGRITASDGWPEANPVGPGGVTTRGSSPMDTWSVAVLLCTFTESGRRPSSVVTGCSLEAAGGFPRGSVSGECSKLWASEPQVEERASA